MTADGDRDTRPVLRLGHSPDPDDAFMWWPLFDRPDSEGDSEGDGEGDHDGDGGPRLDTGRFRYVPVQDDIESLNQQAESGDLEITAMSCAQYPRVRGHYAITACGASLGDAYGPKLISRSPVTPEDLRSPEHLIAIPGERTSAFGALNLLLGRGAFRYDVVPFETIIEAVADGPFTAGLVIHEGQLTYEQAGLHLVADMGRWWSQTRGTPLPLGLNTVRRDLEQRYGPGTLNEIAATQLESVRYALAHRDESIAWAMQFGRGIGTEMTDQFVDLYVNRWTLNFGEAGRRAVRLFLDALHEAGCVPDPGKIDIVEPGVGIADA